MCKIIIQKQLAGHEITADVTIFDVGLCIRLTGGQVTHIGAIGAVSNDGQLEVIQFPEHKEAALSEKWAREVFEHKKCPVVVEAGIHYENASKELIAEILSITDQMLVEVLAALTPA